jgi:hypothetical protein
VRGAPLRRSLPIIPSLLTTHTRPLHLRRPVAFARSPEKSEHDSYDSSRLDLPEGVAPMTPSSAYEMGYQSGGGHTSLTASPPLVPTDAEPPTKRRKSFTAEFKLRVVREALMRPESNRIKPICRVYTQVTPVRAIPPLRRGAPASLTWHTRTWRLHSPNRRLHFPP